jgi:hypothetical protein
MPEPLYPLLTLPITSPGIGPLRVHGRGAALARQVDAVPRRLVCFETVLHFPPPHPAPTGRRLSGYATLEVDTAWPLSGQDRIGVDLDVEEQLFRLLNGGGIRVKPGGLWHLWYRTERGEAGPQRVLHKDRVELAEVPPPPGLPAVYRAETLDDGWYRAQSESPQNGQTVAYVRVADHAIQHVTPCWAMAHRGLLFAYRTSCRARGQEFVPLPDFDLDAMYFPRGSSPRGRPEQW